jgi:hypothetical protein
MGGAARGAECQHLGRMLALAGIAAIFCRCRDDREFEAGAAAGNARQTRPRVRQRRSNRDQIVRHDPSLPLIIRADERRRVKAVRQS